MKTPWDKQHNLVSTTQFNIELFKKLCTDDFNIIDIGCGYGRICKILEDNGYRNIVGIDTSEVLLDRAASQLNYTQLVISDATSLPFKQNHFDCALSFGVINCIINIDYLIKYIKCASEIIKPGGLFFINEYTRNDSPYFDKKYKSGYDEFGGGRIFRSNTGIVYRHYSISQILTILDPYFDLVICEERRFLSMHHNNTVNGYMLVMRRVKYCSLYREMNI